MENELSMNSRAEVTTGYAKAYVKAAKGDKGRILDEVVEVIGNRSIPPHRDRTAAMGTVAEVRLRPLHPQTLKPASALQLNGNRLVR